MEKVLALMVKLGHKNYKQNFNSLLFPLNCIFNLSLSSGTFPDKMKIPWVTPVLKSGDTSLMTNFRPIFVLPCFSKMLERIMYNRLYKCLAEKIYYTVISLDFERGTLQSVQFFRYISWTNKSIFWKERIYSWCVCWFIQSFRHSWP